MLHFMNIYTNKSQLIVSARFQKMLTLFLSDDCHNTNSIQNRFQKIQSKTHETQLFVFFWLTTQNYSTKMHGNFVLVLVTWFLTEKQRILVSGVLVVLSVGDRQKP